MGPSASSTIFTQRSLEVEVLGLNLSCVQGKVHAYGGVFDKQLGWTSGRLVIGGTGVPGE